MKKVIKRTLVYALVLMMALCLVPTVSVEAANKKSVKKVVIKNNSATVTKKTITLEKGKSTTLKVSVTPKSAKKKITYKTSKNAVATVNSNGKITGKKEGTAKITITVTDKNGKKKSTWVKVTVTKPIVPVASVTIDKTNLTLEPAGTAKLSAMVAPANATNPVVTWTSSNPAVAAVAADGTVTAKEEGSAEIKATAEGKSAVCSVKVAYSSTPTTPAALKAALESKMTTNITYSSNASDKIEIAAGDYSSKSLTINAPNAEVINNGTFKSVTINAIADNTYIENSVNTIYYNASAGHIKINENANATVNLNSKGEQKLQLDNDGTITGVYVPAKSKLIVSGKNMIPVTLGDGAEDSEITTSVELEITSEVRWKMAVLPGGETTRAYIRNDNCRPEIRGLGCIAVRIGNEEDGYKLVNIPAEKDDSLGISQTVTVSGSVQEYTLSGNTVDESTLINRSSENTSVYLLPYSAENSNITTNNYKNCLKTYEPVKTDENGAYTIPEVTVGNYWIIAEKDGFRPVLKNVVITSINSETYTDGTIFMLDDNLMNCSATNISGTIINGLTKESVGAEGITVKLRAGNGNIIGEEVLFKTQTDENGQYAFENVEAGIYTLEVADLRTGLEGNATRYNNASKDIVVAGGYLSAEGFDCVVNPVMVSVTGKGQVQFTLTWGNEESGASADIDSHLIGPKMDGKGSFHIYYMDENYNMNDSGSYGDDSAKIADLDVDDTDWSGPEHTTIYQETPGIYRFYVHNFSERGVIGSEKMAKSQIQVVVTIGSSSYPFQCPNKIGNLWYVCDYNSVTHTITPKNEVSDFIDDEHEIGLSQEELNQVYLEQYKDDVRSTLNNISQKLMGFKDNEAKRAYESKIADWKLQAEALTDYQDARKLYEELQDEQEKLSLYDSDVKPDITAENLDSWYFGMSDIYDDDDNVIGMEAKGTLYLYGTEPEKLEITSGDKEGMIVDYEKASLDSGCAYIVHVTLPSGLAYDMKLSILDVSESKIAEKIRSIRLNLTKYESSEVINDLHNELNEVEEEAAGGVTTKSQYEALSTKIQEIEDSLWDIEARFDIAAVTADGLDDWWTTTDSVYDDDDISIIGYRPVLYLARREDVTDSELIGKLEITFDDEDAVYEINPLTEGNYAAVLKVTDSQKEVVKNYYIRITEY